MWEKKQQGELSPVATKSTIKIIYSDQNQSFSLENIIFFHCVAFVDCMHTYARVCLCVCLFVWSFICSLCAAVLCFVCANVFFCAFFILSRIFTFSSPKKSDFQFNHNTCTKRQRNYECVRVCESVSTRLSFSERM